MNVVVCLGRDFLQPEHVMQNEARALKAAELYFSNVASKVILSGGFFSKKDISEAKFLARIIRKAGVPDKDIILEEKSEDTIENAQNCLEIMNVRKFDSAVVVTSNFHLARVKYIFGKIFDDKKLEFVGTDNHLGLWKSIGCWFNEIRALIKLKISPFN